MLGCPSSLPGAPSPWRATFQSQAMSMTAQIQTTRPQWCHTCWCTVFFPHSDGTASILGTQSLRTVKVKVLTGRKRSPCQLYTVTTESLGPGVRQNRVPSLRASQHESLGEWAVEERDVACGLTEAISLELLAWCLSSNHRGGSLRQKSGGTGRDPSKTAKTGRVCTPN